MKRRSRLSSLAGLLCSLLLPCRAGQSHAAEKEYTNSIGMEFALIPAGWYVRGFERHVEKCNDDQASQHTVTISKPFYLGKYEVTQAEWMAVMGNTPSRFKGRTNPVEQVSWNDVQAFVRKLNAKEGHTRYRLPTEAEWEYAARAGTTTAYSFGDDAGSLGQYAWYEDNSGRSTHPVGQKLPNAWGLYDMHGNVWEWVQDWYDVEYSTWSKSTTDPQGPELGYSRVLRGGSWSSSAGSCHSANCYDFPVTRRNRNVGFRLALSPE